MIIRYEDRRRIDYEFNRRRKIHKNNTRIVYHYEVHKTTFVNNNQRAYDKELRQIARRYE